MEVSCSDPEIVGTFQSFLDRQHDQLSSTYVVLIVSAD